MGSPSPVPRRVSPRGAEFPYKVPQLQARTETDRGGLAPSFPGRLFLLHPPSRLPRRLTGPLCPPRRTRKLCPGRSKSWGGRPRHTRSWGGTDDCVRTTHCPCARGSGGGVSLRWHRTYGDGDARSCSSTRSMDRRWFYGRTPADRSWTRHGDGDGQEGIPAPPRNPHDSLRPSPLPHGPSETPPLVLGPPTLPDVPCPAVRSSIPAGRLPPPARPPTNPESRPTPPRGRPVGPDPDAPRPKT